MSGPANLHTLYMRSAPLCVECRACKRRRALGAEKLGHLQGNMKQISRLKLRCECGSTDVERIVPADYETAKLFLGGENIRSADAV